MPALETWLARLLKDENGSDRVAARIGEYERRYASAEERKADYRNCENTCCHLVTDLYERPIPLTQAAPHFVSGGVDLP